MSAAVRAASSRSAAALTSRIRESVAIGNLLHRADQKWNENRVPRVPVARSGVQVSITAGDQVQIAVFAVNVDLRPRHPAICPPGGHIDAAGIKLKTSE